MRLLRLPPRGAILGGERLASFVDDGADANHVRLVLSRWRVRAARKRQTQDDSREDPDRPQEHEPHESAPRFTVCRLALPLVE